MTSTIQTLSDKTIELTIILPWDSVHRAYKRAVQDAADKAELPGFRKGKAPKKLIEEKLDKNSLYEDVIRELVPQAYGDALKTHSIAPIVQPRITLKEAKEGKDWVILAQTCQKPKVTLGNYREAIRKAKTQTQKKIWVPGKDDTGKDEKTDQKPDIESLLRALEAEVTITIPTILLEEQVNKMLSDLVDRTQKLGLTVEQYLSSSGKTADSIRDEYKKDALRTLTLEFALTEISDREHITVDDSDIAKVIDSAKTEEEKARLKKETYYIASVLRRQKTLEFLSAM